MRRVILSIIFIVILLLSAGCNTIARGREEINKIMFIRAIAVDTSYDNEGKVKITVSSERPQPGGESGGTESQKKKVSTINAEGNTILEAVRKLSSFSDRRPFFGHMNLILIGEQAAKDGILKYLDIFIRDYEIRLNARVIIVKGGTAEEAIVKGSTAQSFISEKLDNLFNTLSKLSVSEDLNMVDVMKMLDNPYTSAYIPLIYLGGGTKMEKADKDMMDIMLNGFAVFKGDKLIGYITDDKARGLNWIHGKISSAVYTVKGEKNENINLEVIDSTSKVIPVFTNDKLSILVKIGMSSNISEIQGADGGFDKPSYESLRKQQEAIIKSEIESVITFAQKYNVDILQIGNTVFHKHPVKWNQMKGSWYAIFPKLDIKVTVQSTINRSYDIKQPIRSRTED